MLVVQTLVMIVNRFTISAAVSVVMIQIDVHLVITDSVGTSDHNINI